MRLRQFSYTPSSVYQTARVLKVLALLDKQIMLLMPTLQTVSPVRVMHGLLPLRPTHPVGLRILHNTDHLVWNRQVRINGRRKRMDQFRPMMIPQPEHGAAVGTEVPLRRTLRLGWFSLILDCGVFPVMFISMCAYTSSS